MVCIYCRSAFSLWCQRELARIRLRHDAINVTEINARTVQHPDPPRCSPADQSMAWLLNTRRSEAGLARDRVQSIHGLCCAEAMLPRLLMHEDTIILLHTDYETASCSCPQSHAPTTSVACMAFHLHTATRLSGAVANQELFLFC